MEENTFYFLLLGATLVGSLAGELFRGAHGPEPIDGFQFFASFFAGVFLAYVVGYAVYAYRKDEPMALIIGALSAFQDVPTVQKYLTGFMDKFIGKGAKEE